MLARYAALVLLLIVSVYCDVRSYRVYNLPVLAGLLTGLIINIATDGLYGLASSLLAALLPAAALFVLFALRMLGAGDIKLFCAIGAIMGVRFAAYAIIFSFLSGGVMALGLMLFRETWNNGSSIYTTTSKHVLSPVPSRLIRILPIKATGQNSTFRLQLLQAAS
jgi:prepilin peptidase CpaA